MKNKKRIYQSLIGLLFIVLMLAQTFFINYVFSLGLVAIVLSIINIGIVKVFSDKKTFNLIAGMTLAFVIAEILWMVVDHIVLFVVAQLLFLSIGFWIFGLGIGIHKKMNKTAKSVTLKIVKVVSVMVLAVVSLLMIVLTITPKPFGTVFQSITGDSNDYEPQETITKTIDESYELTNDIQYGDKYPRSYLDILTPTGDFDKNRPTYFYVHGGGFIIGDKMKGDPNASVSDNSTMFFYKDMVDNGYNVVAINYALSPQYAHPIPDMQLSEAVQFMQENGEQYGINMNDVVFAGGSAGGYITAEFITIQANPEYAKRVGIEPVIDLENIKGLVLEVPALDPNRGHKTDKEQKFIDYIFGQSLAAYFDQPLISPDQEKLDDFNLIENLTENFPATFITDGNTGSFADQAIDYHNRLEELGVESELYIPDINESVEIHGYMSSIGSKASNTYIEKRIDFLNSLD